jgi:hypothetical protein
MKFRTELTKNHFFQDFTSLIINLKDKEVVWEIS